MPWWQLLQISFYFFIDIESKVIASMKYVRRCYTFEERKRRKRLEKFSKISGPVGVSACESRLQPLSLEWPRHLKMTAEKKVAGDVF